MIDTALVMISSKDARPWFRGKFLPFRLFTLCVVAVCVAAMPSHCQTFQKTIGGAGFEFLHDVKPTRDGRYLMTGNSASNHTIPNSDLFVIKLDELGDTLWSRVYGGGLSESGYFVLPLEDLGAVIVGNTYSFGAGSADGFFLRIDEDGDIISSRTYGGIWNDAINSAMVDHDGGFILLGTLGTGNGGREILLMTTDNLGDVQWSKTYGVSVALEAWRMIRLADNILIGGFIGNSSAGLLIKVTPTGEIIWSNAYEGVEAEQVRGIEERADGSLLVTGMTSSFGAFGTDGDVYLMKTDPMGVIQWAWTYGGGGTDMGEQVMELPGGDLMVIGQTWSFGNGQRDAYVLRTDSLGELIWSRAYGGALIDSGVAMDTTSTGGFLLWGMTRSYGAGLYDIYMIRTDSSGYSGCNEMDVPTQMTEAAFITDPYMLMVTDVELNITEPAVLMARGSIVHELCSSGGVGLGEPLTIGSFHMYPNPVNELLSIEMPETTGRYALQIHNSSGQLVFNGQFSDQLSSIDLKGQPQGLYMVTITTGSWRSTQRLVVDR